MGTILKIAGKKMLETAEKNINSYAKTITNSASKQVQQFGNQNGVSYGNHIEKKEYITENTEVKKIKTYVNSLDDGSANDGIAGNTQKGLKYDKEYAFEVEEFTKGNPKDEKNIKWIIKYHSLSKGKWVETTLSLRGKSIRIKTNNTDVCGRFLYIKAYINKSNWIAKDELKTSVTDAQREQKGELKLWHHNRFRWFDKQVIHKQAEERAIDPWKVDQGGTSLCGMASLFYLLAKKDGKGYEKMAKELFRTGSYKYNSYTIEPHKNAKDTMYNVNPYKDSEHPNIPEVDWITLGSVRSKESSFLGELLYKGKKGQDAEAINWPTLMKPLGKNLLGYKDVGMDYYKVNKSYIRDYFGSNEKLRILEKDIDKDYKNGYQICLLIDSSMLSNDASYSLDDFQEYHWIVYEGDLELLNGTKSEIDYDKVTNINFSVYTWAEKKDNKTISPLNNKPFPKVKISKKAFITNYYGYLKLK